MPGRSLFVLIAAIMALGLAACQPQKGAGRAACPAGERCLEYGNLADPLTLDPDRQTTVNDYAITAELIQGLTDSGPDGQPVPGMADHWETSPDGLTWTFHLRKALWSDGTPVTAGDFVFAYRRILDPKVGAPYAYMLFQLKNGEAVSERKAPPESLGVRALDARTLQMTLEHPAPYMLQLVKHQTYFPVPEHVVRRWGDAWVEPGHMVSNGPYVLVSSKLGDYVRIQKNPLFWDARNVCFNRIDYYPTTDNEVAERRVKRGELDVNTTFASNRLGFLRGEDGMAAYVRVHPYLATTYIALNVGHVKALQDLRVRQALSMSIDRDFLTQKLLRAGQIPTTSFVPPYISGYEAGAHAAWSSLTFAQRQDEARRLLAEAGYGPSHPLKIAMLVGIGSDALLLPQALAEDWKTINVDMTISQEESQLTFQSMQNRDFEISIIGWIADYNDPKTFLDLLKSGTGAQNYGDYSNPRYDALLNAADLEPDVHKRAHLLSQAEQIIIDDAAVIPLYYAVNRNLVSPRVTGWVDNVGDVHRGWYLCLNDAGQGRAKSAP